MVRIMKTTWTTLLAVVIFVAFDSDVLAAKPGGGTTQDIGVCIAFSGLRELDGDGLGLYCDSHKRITAFVGRRRSIRLSVPSNSGRALTLTLGRRLIPIDGDPINPTGAQPVGPIVTDRFIVLYQTNLSDEDSPFTKSGNARLQFTDANGDEWTLEWGPDLVPGGAQMTNPNAPPATVERVSRNEWQADSGADGNGTHVAFLWLASRTARFVSYAGAHDVSFSYTATREQ